MESLDDPKAKTLSIENGSAMALSPDGRFVATRGPDQKVYLFPVEGGEANWFPGLQPREVTAWSADGRSLFVTEGTNCQPSSRRPVGNEVLLGKRSSQQMSAGVDTGGGA